jgi:diguanylate cyclase (GGDEF)-like protein
MSPGSGVDSPNGSGSRHRVRHDDSDGHVEIERDPHLIAAISEAVSIREARDRAHSPIPVPDRMSGLLTGGSFLAALAIWLLIAPPAIPLGLLAACVAAHAAAASIEFEMGPGLALPTTPVLYVALFLLPPVLVPVTVLAGLGLAAVFGRLRDPNRHERPIVLAGSAWHSMGPAAVFALAGVTGPAPAAVWVCAAALATQFACDGVASWVRNVYGLGVSTRELAGGLLFTFLADLALAPVGVAAAFAIPGSPAALLVLAGPMLLLGLRQRDREHQIDRAVVLSEAFAKSADRARRDVLTGLRNRLAWEEAVAVNAELPGPIGVVLADVDGLKATNDAFGHEAGDKLLVAIAGLIAAVTPAEALAARLGGDEFGILLPGSLADHAATIADELRRSIGDSGGGPPNGLRLSASVGYGTARSGALLAMGFMEADRRVYEDKARRSAGRR